MFLHFTKSTRLLRFFLALFKEMTVAGICRITCDVNALLEVILMRILINGNSQIHHDGAL